MGVGRSWSDGTFYDNLEYCLSLTFPISGILELPKAGNGWVGGRVTELGWKMPPMHCLLETRQFFAAKPKISERRVQSVRSNKDAMHIYIYIPNFIELWLQRKIDPQLVALWNTGKFDFPSFRQANSRAFAASCVRPLFLSFYHLFLNQPRPRTGVFSKFQGSTKSLANTCFLITVLGVQKLNGVPFIVGRKCRSQASELQAQNRACHGSQPQTKDLAKSSNSAPINTSKTVPKRARRVSHPPMSP